MSDDTTRAIDELNEKVDYLNGLFARRLSEDKSRAALTASLQEEIQALRDLLEQRSLESLFLELLLAIDRLQSEPTTPEFVESAVAELLEAFARRGVRAVQDAEFSPQFHEVVGTIPETEEIPAGTIAAVQRTGYVIGDRLLRPTRVTIATGRSATERQQPAATAAESEQ